MMVDVTLCNGNCDFDESHDMLQNVTKILGISLKNMSKSGQNL